MRGDREINPEQADIVRRIFTEYANGLSPKKIAIQLNKENIPNPSGKAWGPSTINGNRRRGTGILNNDFYSGQLVWNRQKFFKDPDTGKRVARANPVSEWQIREVPHLRIIDQPLWDSVKARQKALDEKPQYWIKRRPPNLFSYLLKCGCCGGGMSKISSERYGCSSANKKGTCDNHLTIKQEQLECIILNALQNHLMNGELVTAFCNEYTSHINILRKNRNAAIHRLQKELQKLAEGKRKIIEAIKNGIPASGVKDELNSIIARRTAIETCLEGKEEATVLLHPGMALRYTKKVSALIEALNTDNTRAAATELLRSLIDDIILSPKDSGKAYSIHLCGELAGILTITSGKNKKIDEHDPVIKQDKKIIEGNNHCPDHTLAKDQDTLENFRQDKMVAGARNQRYLLITEAV